MLAEVTAENVVYDLGSGDGRIVIAAAREYGARGVGIEINPELISRRRGKRAASRPYHGTSTARSMTCPADM